MANTFYNLNSYTTTASDGTSITLSNIDQTYTDLCIMVNAADKGSTAFAGTYLRFNNDSGTNYWWKRVMSNQGSGFTDKGDSASAIDCGYWPGANLTNQFVGMRIYITNYRWGNGKNVLVKTVQEGNVATTSMYTPIQVSGYWNGTGAITSITLGTSGSGFTTGSTFDVYGIKSS